MAASEPARRSPTNRDRREQIVDTAIELLAYGGYPACTFKAIAGRAELSSTRLISYHFAGKDDLVSAVLSHVLETVGTFTAKRTTDHADARAALAGYLRTAVALNDTHRAEMRALTEIVLHHRHPDGDGSYSPDDEESAVGRVEQILREGQQTGLFRDFDPWVMATTVQRSVDGIAFLVQVRPGLDLDHYGEELVTTFDLATRA